MSKLNFATLTVVTVFVLNVVLAVAGASKVQAADNVCFCHNLTNNPITICTDNEGLINGHQGHVDNGTDSLGECPVPPQVPEFGLITGSLALIGSAGSFLVMKRKNSKK